MWTGQAEGLWPAVLPGKSPGATQPSLCDEETGAFAGSADSTKYFQSPELRTAAKDDRALWTRRQPSLHSEHVLEDTACLQHVLSYSAFS